MFNINQKIKENGVRFLAVLGLAAILGLGAFVVVKTYSNLEPVASRIYSAAVSLSRIFHPAEKLILESSDLDINSGEAVVLSFTHTGLNSDGVFELSYPCKGGLALSIITGRDTATSIACETPFTILTSKDSVGVKIFSTENRFIDLPITLSFVPKGATGASVSTNVLLLVNNRSISDITTTPVKTSPTPIKIVQPVVTKNPVATPVKTPVTAGPKTEKVYPVTNTTITKTGNADLVARILEIGIIDKTSNTFVSTNVLRKTDRIAVRFEVENIGYRATGDWRFNAALPTYPFYIFSSDGQQSLNPGDKIEFTLGFDKIEKAQDNTVVVNVDPASSINELSEDNNIVKTVINGVIF